MQFWEEPPGLSHHAGQKLAWQEEAKNLTSFLCRTASAPRVFGTDRLQGLRTKSSPFSTKSREVLLHQAFEVMSKSLPSSDEGLQAVDILCQDCTRIPASSSTCRRKSLLSHSNAVARSGIPSGTVFNHYHSLRDISSQHLTAEPVSQNWWGTGVLPGRLTQGTYARAWVHASISWYAISIILKQKAV